MTFHEKTGSGKFIAILNAIEEGFSYIEDHFIISFYSLSSIIINYLCFPCKLSKDDLL